MNQPQLFVEERKPRAVFSECELHLSCESKSCSGRRYRYQLWWPTGLDNDFVAVGIFANPSTATAESLDPTLTRWRNYCRRWGYGWSVTVNLRAWRETDPRLVPSDPKAVGEMGGYSNWSHMLSAVHKADIVVCGWGNLGSAELSDKAIRLIRNARKVPHALKLNRDGTPAHPLYLRADLKPFPMEES